MEAIKNYFSVLFGTKTGRTALLAMIGIVVAYFNKELTPDQAIGALFVAIQTVNIRDAVKKATPATGGGGTGEVS